MSTVQQHLDVRGMSAMEYDQAARHHRERASRLQAEARGRGDGRGRRVAVDEVLEVARQLHAVPAGASDIVTYDDMSYSDGIQVSTNSQTAPAAACKPPRAQLPSPSPANTAGSAGDGRVLRAVVRALQEPGSGVRTGRNRAGR